MQSECLNERESELRYRFPMSERILLLSSAKNLLTKVPGKERGRGWGSTWTTRIKSKEGRKEGGWRQLDSEKSWNTENKWFSILLHDLTSHPKNFILHPSFLPFSWLAAQQSFISSQGPIKGSSVKFPKVQVMKLSFSLPLTLSLSLFRPVKIWREPFIINFWLALDDNNWQLKHAPLDDDVVQWEEERGERISTTVRNCGKRWGETWSIQKLSKLTNDSFNSHSSLLILLGPSFSLILPLTSHLWRITSSG